MAIHRRRSFSHRSIVQHAHFFGIILLTTWTIYKTILTRPCAVSFVPQRPKRRSSQPSVWSPEVPARFAEDKTSSIGLGPPELNAEYKNLEVEN